MIANILKLKLIIKNIHVLYYADYLTQFFQFVSRQWVLIIFFKN